MSAFPVSSVLPGMNEVDFYGCVTFSDSTEGRGLSDWAWRSINGLADVCARRFEYSSAEWRPVECLAVSLTTPDVTSEKSSIAAKKPIPKMPEPTATVF
jgi:hypothetical protein